MQQFGGRSDGRLGKSKHGYAGVWTTENTREAFWDANVFYAKQRELLKHFFQWRPFEFYVIYEMTLQPNYQKIALEKGEETLIRVLPLLSRNVL